VNLTPITGTRERAPLPMTKGIAMKEPRTPPRKNGPTHDCTDAHPDPVSGTVASGDADAARELALLLTEADLSCAVNPYEPTSVIVALLEDAIAPYAQETCGPDEDQEEFVPSMTLTARARGNSDEIPRGGKDGWQT
jgi:hypothetical protein